MLIYLLRPRTTRHSGTFTHKKKRASQRVRLTRACISTMSRPFKWALMMMTVVRQRTTMNSIFLLVHSFIYKNDENDGRENENCFATFLLCWTYTRMTTTAAMMMMRATRAERFEDFNCLAHSACSGWRLTLPLLFFCHSHSVEFRV